MAAPSVKLSWLTNDTGKLATDYITSDTNFVLNGTISGTGTIGVWVLGGIYATPTLITSLTATGVTSPLALDFAALLGSTPADAQYTFSFTNGTAAGSHVLATKAVTLDTSIAIPDAPTITSGDSGVVGDGLTRNTTVKLEGNTEAGAKVDILDNGSVIGTVTANASGHYVYSAAKLTDGGHDFTVAVTDKAGNTATSTASTGITVDTSTFINPITLVNDTGASATDGFTSAKALHVVGSAEAGDSVDIIVDGTKVATVTADAVTGAYSYTTADLADGRHVITAKATDAVGNTATVKTGYITIDTTVGKPTIDLTAASDTGKSSTDNITKDASVVVTGNAEAGATVTVFDGSTALGTAVADNTGHYTFTTGHLADGAHQLSATQVDLAGNTSVASASLKVTVDTVAPTASAPTLTGGDTGVLGDNLTNAATIKVGGSAEAGASVQIFDGTTLVGTTSATGAGTYSASVSGLSEGVHHLHAVATDTAGNQTVTSALDVTVDRTAPVISNIVVAGDDVVTKAEAKSGFAITGNTDATDGQVVTVKVTDSHGYVLESETAVVSHGGFSAHFNGNHFTTTNGGTLAVTATVADAAGNVGQIVKSFTSTVCFMPGTLVATPKGPVAVETLVAGDLVLTVDGKAAPVRWLGRQTVSMLFADPLRVLPIRVKAGAIADNVPSRDLLVSPDHALEIDGVLIHAGALVNGTSIVREENVPQVFTYFHVELADHSLILAENTPAETFIDNVDRLAFDNWMEHEAIISSEAPLAEMSMPRAKSFRQVPKATRQRLAQRGGKLFGAHDQASVA